MYEYFVCVIFLILLIESFTFPVNFSFMHITADLSVTVSVTVLRGIVSNHAIRDVFFDFADLF